MYEHVHRAFLLKRVFINSLFIDFIQLFTRFLDVRDVHTDSKIFFAGHIKYIFTIRFEQGIRHWGVAEQIWKESKQKMHKRSKSHVWNWYFCRLVVETWKMGPGILE